MSGTPVAPAGDVVCANIGPKQRRRRTILGVASLSLGLALYVALLFSRASPLWHATLLLPFAAAGYGIFQALDKT